MKTLSIVIPVYNESATLTQLLDLVAAAPLSVEREILIVNDGSTDDSEALARAWADAQPAQLKVSVLSKANGGKGSAVRMGIEHSTGDVVIIQDADLEYDPGDYQACIDPILRGEQLVVYGSRERMSKNRLHSSLSFYAGGLAVTYWMNLLYGSTMTDEPTCYKTFSGPLIRALSFRGNHFEWEPEVTAKLLRLGIHIHEVPVSYFPRKVSDGKKINWRDGVQALTEALYWRFTPLSAERKRLAGVEAGDLARRLSRSRWPWWVLAVCIAVRAAVSLSEFSALTMLIAALAAVPVIHIGFRHWGTIAALIGGLAIACVPVATLAGALSLTCLLFSGLWLANYVPKKRLIDLWLAAVPVAGTHGPTAQVWIILGSLVALATPGKSWQKRLLGLLGWLVLTGLGRLLHL